jgi:crossover junction endodeoxyribonuclease RusA
MEVTLDLPYPISSNRYWRKFRNKMVLNPEAKEYRQEVYLLAKRVMKEEPTKNRVGVRMLIRRPARRRDLDNHQKVIFDALQGAVYVNDSQIFKLEADMVDRPKDPGVTVTVWELEE